MDSARHSDRRRVAKLAFILIFVLGLFLVLRAWHGRAIDIELVHQVASSSELLPAEIMIQVWGGETLHADAYFPNPSSLEELSHSVRVPPGEYRVTFTLMHDYPEPEYRFTRRLHVEDEGRYFLRYDAAELPTP